MKQAIFEMHGSKCMGLWVQDSKVAELSYAYFGPCCAHAGPCAMPLLSRAMLMLNHAVPKLSHAVTTLSPAVLVLATGLLPAQHAFAGITCYSAWYTQSI